MAAVLDVEQPVLLPSNSLSSINFEELFNMELFGLPSSQSPGNPSRASSNSPSSSFFSLPPATPPQPQVDSFSGITADSAIEPSFFDFSLSASTLSKSTDLSANSVSPSDATSPASSVPYDFFGSFAGSGSNSSPDTASLSAFSPKEFFAIDPTLVGGPSSSSSSSSAPKEPHRSQPDEESDDSEDENEEEPVIKPMKVGGKGKASRKGTVASGGIVKRTPGVTSAVKDKISTNDDDWRPSPEEYKKMSSKEKRQLRNKISARNFRVRRKEYITTLEGDIAERDRLIDSIREELGSTKLENVALRQEVEALKRAMLEGRAGSVLPPPAPLTPSPTSNPPATNLTNTNRSTRTLAKPNTQKDLPTSPRVSPGRAFWAGSSTAFGGAGGITTVHTTLVPEFTPFSDKHSHRDQQENINPALNLPCFGGVGATTPNPKFPLSPFHQSNLGTNFDAFADLNPFTLKTLDAYRMQLWGRMAREAGSQQRQRAQLSSQNQPLVNALRPAYFAPSALQSKERDTAKQATPVLSALLSGKVSSANPYPSPSPSPSPPSRAAEIQPQHAVLASLASQTLLSKMSSAFWDAFAGPVSGSPATSSVAPSAFKADLDHDKVRRVLEGKAVVRVVDVETPPALGGASSSSADALEESMRSLSIGGPSESAGACCKSCSSIFSRTRAAVVGKK